MRGTFHPKTSHSRWAARLIGGLATLALVAWPVSAQDARPADVMGVPAHLGEAVKNPDRPGEDQARDADRRPAEVLSFFRIEPGMKVAEMMAGAGYYTEILSRAVGAEGRVYAHNSPFVLQRYAEQALSSRLERMKASNVVRLNSEPGEPNLPRGLDAALLIRFYHDFYWQGVDRAAFNRALFAALKPGGIFGVVDHHAEAGSGDRDAKEAQGLHRVDGEMVKKEIVAAGFVLEDVSSVLSRPEDSRDWFIFVDDGAKRDKTDRFVYRFRKPAP